MDIRMKFEKMSEDLNLKIRDLSAAKKREQRALLANQELRHQLDEAQGVVSHSHGTRKASLANERQLRLKAEEGQRKAEKDAQAALMKAIADLNLMSKRRPRGTEVIFTFLFPPFLTLTQIVPLACAQPSDDPPFSTLPREKRMKMKMAMTSWRMKTAYPLRAFLLMRAFLRTKSCDAIPP